MNDRGIIKWQGFFMPEHVVQLREMQVDYYKTEKPVLDEAQLQQIDETIHTSMEFQLPLIFTIWIDGFMQDVTGIIHYIDQTQRQLRVKDYFGNVLLIDYGSVVEVEFDSKD